MKLLTATRLKELLSYNPETGIFLWYTTGSGRRKDGIAGSKNKLGYIQIAIDYKKYNASRLAWFYMTGKWPENEIDHKNTIRSDNRFCNLREADRYINMQNKIIHNKNNKLSCMGVCSDKNRFRVQIRVSGKRVHVGRFNDIETAKEAYILAKRKFHLGNLL